MKRFLPILLLVAVGVPFAIWGGMALWLRLPFADPVRAIVAAGWIGSVMLAAVLVLNRRILAGAGVALAATAALMIWWGSLLPSGSRNWQPDVLKVATASIDGDLLQVNNIRTFHWRSETDFDQSWETREYRISQLRGADLFLSYWSGEAVAHAIVSFDFADAEPLAFSIEIRKEVGEAYSAFAGFFKTYELAVIASDERDVVKVRSTVRGEDVRIFRLDIERATAEGLLREYVALANDAAKTPRWYNTLTANCTTVIFGMARRLDPSVSLDWRILLPGKLPAYLRENEFVSRDVTLDELVRLSRIGPRAAGAFPDKGFSARIREGVPHPAAAVLPAGSGAT